MKKTRKNKSNRLTKRKKGGCGCRKTQNVSNNKSPSFLNRILGK